MSIKQELDDICISNGRELHLVSYGIASSIGKDILLNREALKYPNYAKRLILHEIRHSLGFSKNDLMLDLKESYDRDNLKFLIRHPSALLQLIPFGFWRGKFWIDILLIIYYILIVGLIWMIAIIIS